MPQDIYDPLTEYINVFRDRFKEVADTTFAQLAEEAHIDIEANRETCRQLYKVEDKISSVNSSISNWKAFRTVLWVFVAGGIVASFLIYDKVQMEVIIVICLAEVVCLLLLLKVYSRLKNLGTESNSLTDKANKLKSEAWEQMSPLNSLYDWDVLTRMMSKTVPRLEFDPYFTTQRLADLKMTYNWSDSFNEERSVIYSHSGLINGNPFVICRTRKMDMGSKTYYGQKTIYWTTRERDVDGKYHAVTHSQTLVAEVTAPYPNYPEKTWLIYGNTAAPDLTFYRQQSGLAGKEKSFSFKRQKRSLKKKARELTDSDFAMMTNEEFEVAFNTSNRNNNQQFALLFTPLAQESMLKLLKDKEAGYGDDFDFEKNKMINSIVSNHMQELNLDMNPEQYRNFDYDKAKRDFLVINSRYFRAIYFNLAPLLCVPMYQQIRPHHDIYGHDMQRRSAFWEHEALANFWGQEHFMDPSCVTNCILKTEQTEEMDESSTITVHAYGYRSEQRLTYVKKFGNDGYWHDVPVYWDEYLPVTGCGKMYMREDNDFNDSSITQRQRLDHISEVLQKANLDIYRRHIASKA